MTLNPLYRYNGVSGGDVWHQRIFDYLVSKCPDIEVLLRWAEKQDTALVTEGMIRSTQFMMEEAPVVLSGHIFGFLGACLDGDARTTFDSIPTRLCGSRNGLEAWRALSWRIRQGREFRKNALKEAMDAMKPVRDYAHISGAIDEYDKKLKEYEAAGGDRPTESDLKRAVLKLMPHELREALIFKASDPGGFMEFKEALRYKVAMVMSLRGTTPAHALEHQVGTASLVDIGEGTPSEAGSKASSLQDMVNAMGEELMLAIDRKFGGNTRSPLKRPNPTRQNGAPGAGNQTRTFKCLNCGSDKHRTAECPKPKVEPRDRPCFECGGKGHQARNCPNKPGKKGQLRYLGEDEEADMLCVDCEAGWWPAMKPAKAMTVRPTPATHTLGDAIGEAFRKLKAVDIAEEKHEKPEEVEKVMGQLEFSDDEIMVPNFDGGEDDSDCDSSDDGTDDYYYIRAKDALRCCTVTASAGMSGVPSESPLTRCEPKHPGASDSVCGAAVVPSGHHAVPSRRPQPQVGCHAGEHESEVPEGYTPYMKNRIDKNTASGEPTLRAEQDTVMNRNFLYNSFSVHASFSSDIKTADKERERDRSCGT